MSLKQRTIHLIIAGKDKVTGTLSKIKGTLKSWGAIALKSVAAVGTAFTVLGGGIAAVGAKMAGLIDEQAKVASKLGLTTEALSILRDAAGYAGIASNTLDMALQRMTRRVSEAANGTGEAVKALEELGLNAEELNRKSPDQALLDIVAALEKVDNQADKVRLAFKLFDSEGVSMVNLTSAGLRQAAADAEAFGLKVTTAQAAAVEAANDAWTRITAVVGDFLKYITAQVAPRVESTLTAAFEFLKTVDFKGFADRAAGALVSVAQTAASVIPRSLILILTGVERVAMAFSGWKLLWAELTYQFGWFMKLIWTGLNATRNYTNGVIERMQALGFISKDFNNEDGLRIAQEQQQILAMIDSARNDALQKQREEIQQQGRQNQQFDQYKQQVESVGKILQDLMSDTKTSAQVAVSAEQAKIEKINSTTAAIDRQIDAYRRLRAEQGRAPSQGSVQYVSSPASMESGLEKAERTE